MQSASLRRLVAVLVVAASVLAVGASAQAQVSGCITTPFGTFCFGTPGTGGGPSSTCPGLSFPLPTFPGLNCGHFQGGGYRISALSPSIQFYNPGGPTTIAVSQGTSGIPIFITNLPINQRVTILLADIIIPAGGAPQILLYNLSGFHPTGQAMVNAYAGNRGVEVFIAWVDANGNGVVDLGELTIPWLNMFVA